MSSIPAVKTALKVLLAAALPNTQVVYGPASSVTTLGQRVLEVGVVTGTLDVTGMDLRSGTEQYSVMLTASTSIPGTDQTEADDAALADFQAAVTAIRSDPTLGINNLAASVSGTFEMPESAVASGRSAAVRFPVTVIAPF